MLRVIYSQLVNVGSLVGKGWVGGLGVYGCVFANIKRVVENYNTPGFGFPGLSEAALCFSKKIAETGWVPRFLSRFSRLGGVNQEVAGDVVWWDLHPQKRRSPFLQGGCWLGKRTQCCLEASFVRVLIQFLKGNNQKSWFHHISHWVSAPEFWRRHIQTRASDFIDALNYSSWVATDGINAESQIRFYRETIQGPSVLCTPLCILKSLYLVDWAVSFVSSPASGGIDSIINVLLSHGY